jgi:hypothetical protein
MVTVLGCALHNGAGLKMPVESDDARLGSTAFEAILAPLSVDQFLGLHLGIAPLHLSGAAGRFHHLLDWDRLARLLESHPLEPPRFSIVKAGKTIPGERYLRQNGGGIARIDSGALSLLLDAGATAIINHVDDLVPAIGALADEVADRLAARTAVNLYASWRSESGFAPHWDYHDVIVLQLAGRKQWTIHKPTRPDPLRGDAFEAPPEGAAPECVEILEDGDMLYVPRGWIHAPVPAGEPSLHLTIAITRPTGAGFLAWLAKELAEDPRVRAAIPSASDQAATVEWERGLASIFEAAMAGGAPARYLTHKDAERGARPRFSFADFGRIAASEWNSATELRPASLHRLILKTAPDGSALVTAVGQRWPCSAAVGAALGRLTSTEPLTLGALEAGLSEADAAQMRQLLVMLATFGLLAAGTA